MQRRDEQFEAYLRHQAEFQTFLQHRRVFQEEFLPYKQQLQPVLGSLKRIREQAQPCAEDVELHQAIYNVQQQQTQRAKLKHEKQVAKDKDAISAALTELEERAPEFMTDPQWTKFYDFVQTLCTEQSEYIGYVMCVKDILETPFLLCLEWTPRASDQDKARSWTGNVVVFARLVVDKKTRMWHWENHPAVPQERRIVTSPFNESVGYENFPVRIPSLTRFQDGSMCLHNLGVYSLLKVGGVDRVHLEPSEVVDEDDDADEYNFQKDDAGIEACALSA